MPYALITGASKGIGKAIAFELASRNYDLLLTARSAELLKEVAEEIEKGYPVKVFYFVADLAAKDATQQLFDWCSIYSFDLKVLVNNAGFGMSGKFESNSLEENTEMIQLNAVVPTQLCQLFLPILKKNTPSYILNIISTSAYQAVPLLGIYAATKAYLLSFSRAISHELKPQGISVTALSPGPTDTEWIHRAKITGKALQMANKVNMQPYEVASIAVKAMFAGKTEEVTGFLNKAGAFFAWLLPKKLVESTTVKMYK